MIPATYPSILDSSNRTKMLVYQVPSITGLTRWVDYIPVKSPTSESDLTLANTFANEGFILTSKVNDITGLVPFKDYVPIYLDSTATKAWSADNDGYIPMAELAGLLLDFTTGTLDSRINFTRTTNATVTNSAGQITYAPHNLLTYSEQFDNAAWTKTTTTVSANAIASPVSTTTGDTLTAGGANSTTLHSYTAIAQPYTFSIYIRRRTGTGNIEITADGSTYVAKTITSDWARYDTTITPTAGTRTPGVRIVTSGDAIDVWGAQLEIGSTATTYNSTTVKNILGYSELFDNAAWTKSNSFVQTNLLTYSEDFTVAGWAKTTVTATANSFIAPNGYQTADTLLATSANSTALQTFTASAVPYTFSVYLYRKTGTGNIDITVDGTTWVTKTITTGWTRVDTTLTPAAGSKTAGIRIATNGDEVYTWGAQLVQGSVAGDYRRTDAAALPVYYPNHNGVVCAEQLHGTAANGTILESYTATGGSMTMSIWIRRITGTGNVDLTMDSGSTYTTQTITSSWARYSITSSPTAGAKTTGIRLVTSGDIVQVFGAMVSDSASLDPYVLNAAAAPTAAAYYGPRFDYDPVTLAPKGLLIEEQRSNLLLNSVIAGTNLATQNVTVTAVPHTLSFYGAGAINLSGVYSGVVINSESTYGTELITNVADREFTSDTGYWIKAGLATIGSGVCNLKSNSYLTKTNLTTIGKTYRIEYDLTVRGGGLYITPYYTATNQTTSGRKIFYITASTSTVTFVVDAAGGDVDVDNITIKEVTLAGAYPSRTTLTFTPTAGTLTLTVSGTVQYAQLEIGSFATSFIPTAASQVTRAADVATIQGSNFYSWYNQNEGSIVSNNTKVSTTIQDMYVISDGTLSNSLAIYADIYNGTVAWNRANGVSQVFSSLGEGVTNSKTAYAYKIDNSAASVNGLNVVTDTVCLTPIVSQMSFGSQNLNIGGPTKQKWIKSISYYPQRLSNDVLKGLTA